MEITEETTMLAVHIKKETAAHTLLHSCLCRDGRALCCIADLKIGEAAKLAGEEAGPLIEKLNLIPDKL